MKTKKKELFIFIGCCVVLGIICIFLYKPLIHLFENLQTTRQILQNHGILGQLIMILIMCLQVIFIFLPGEIVEIMSGYLYGSITGLILCLIGSALGSTFIYLFVKRFGIHFVERFIDREKLNEIGFLKNKERLNILCFILFFIPGTPKDMLTYFIPLTDMKLSTFLFITTIARIPSIITSTVGGNALGVENYIFSLGIFTITGILSLIGFLIYRKITVRKAINYNL